MTAALLFLTAAEAYLRALLRRVDWWGVLGLGLCAASAGVVIAIIALAWRAFA